LVCLGSYGTDDLVVGKLSNAKLVQVQILLFATLAIELKRRAPNAHTFLEVIRARYGVYAHVVFMVFGLMTNILYVVSIYIFGSARGLTEKIE
jgi:Na+/proline symporter